MSGARFPVAAGRFGAALVFGSACAARALGPPNATPRAAPAAAVASIVERGRDELHLSGVAVVVLRGDDVVLGQGYGLANRTTGNAPTIDTVYPAGLGPPPRIRDLLNQTSGLSEWDEWPELQDVDTGDPDRFQRTRFLAALAKHPPLYAPGAWWSYSNTNYRLLAEVVEQVSGEDHDLYLARTLLEPLRLGSTGGCASSRLAAAAPRASGYEFEDGAFVLRPLTDVKAHAFVGSGGMCSTAADLARWMRALVGGRAVSVSSFRDMITPAAVSAGFTAPYGFGLSLRPLAGQAAVWHIGVLAGYTAVLAYFPERDVVIAAVANERHALLHTVVKRIAAAILRLPAAPPLRDLTIDGRERYRVVGEYHDGMFPFRVYAQGDALFVHVPPLGPPLRLRYQGGHEFATAGPEDLRFRFEPAEGPVRRVDWEWGELRAFGRRVP
jgi:CubicO group peptidase (beta-lactamase class C family)